MPDAAAATPAEPEDSDFELDVDDDDDVPLAKKKQKSARCDIYLSICCLPWSVNSHFHVHPVSCLPPFTPAGSLLTDNQQICRRC